jgi:hypothetical protein
MAQRQVAISRRSVVRQRCHHYWMIDSPTGPISRGRCRLCGAQREFRNYLRDCLGVSEDEFKDWLKGPGYEKEQGAAEKKNLKDLKESEEGAVEAVV